MNGHLDNILVPTDFTDHSLLALEQAAVIAKKTGKGITLLHVRKDTEKSTFFSLFTREETEKMRDDYVNRIRIKLDDIAKEYSTKLGVVITSMLAKGKAYDKVVEVAELVNADCIVMMLNNQKHGDDKGYVGANTTKIVLNAPCPVITLNKSDVIKDFNTIVLPIDLTKETRQKVSHAIKFAKEHKAKIKIVAAILDADDEGRKKLFAQLDQITKFVLSKDLDCDSEIVFGKKENDTFDKLILDFVSRSDADLLIIMTQAENVLIKSYFGSTAINLYHYSPIPVMSVVPKELEITKYQA